MPTPERSNEWRTPFPEGSIHVPQSASTRIVFFCMWLTVMALYLVYSGNLTAFLSIPRLLNPPKDARELVERGYVPSITRGFSQYDYMKVKSSFPPPAVPRLEGVCLVKKHASAIGPRGSQGGRSSQPIFPTIALGVPSLSTTGWRLSIFIENQSLLPHKRSEPKTHTR